MIIITGPGRSGTSLLARLYKELGFDPGGEWHAPMNAGFEAEPVQRLNTAIIQDLGLDHWGDPGGRWQQIRKGGKLFIPPPLRARVRSHLQRLPLPMMSVGSPRFVDWHRWTNVVAKYRDEIRALASHYEVVKDPQFAWTLGVWASARAQIDYVLITVRALDASAKSHLAGDTARFRSLNVAKNSLIYGMGLCMTALFDHCLPHSIVRFPDFLDTPDALYETLRFPRPVSRESFIEAFIRIRDPNLVHFKP